MKKLSKPMVVFLIGLIGTLLLFFLFPINLFDGIYVIENGKVDIHREVKTSLSYFIGMGYNEGDLNGIKSFYLKPVGYIEAMLFIVGIPALIGYRFYLKNKSIKAK